MASTRRTSAALAVTDVWKVVVGGTWLAAETLTITVGTKSIVITLVTTVTTASIATAIKEAWNGETITGDATRSESGADIPEFAEATASIGATTSTVLITMDTPGVPIVISVGETSASGTLTLTNSTVASGPNFWGGTANWDNGVPADGDTVYLDNSDIGIFYDLDQSAIEPAAMYVALSYTGNIGLPEINENGQYHEYRSQYLSIGPLILQIGAGPGTGSGRIKINSTTDQTALTVLNTGTSNDTLPALLWKGTHASNTLVMSGGSVGVAVFGGETATIATVSKSGGDLTTGAGVTLSGALQHDGGTWVINSLIDTSLTQTAGQTLIAGSANVDQLTIQGGNVLYNTTGTLGGATVVGGDGVLDFSGSSVPITVSAVIDIFGNGSRIIDPNKRCGSLAVDGNQGADPGTQVVWGTNYRLTRGSVA